MIIVLRVVNFATSKNLAVKSLMFLHRNIRKYTYTSPDGKTYNQIDHVLIGGGNQVYLMYDLSGELTVILITIWWLQKLRKDWRQVNEQLRSLMRRDLLSRS
jgi:hypothetical protein